MSASVQALEAAADRLESAAVSRTPCAPVSDLLGGSDIDAAYQVQKRLTARRVEAGARIVGRKIGLTSAAVQAQIGVDRPDFGVLFDDMRFSDDQVIPFSRLLQPKAEAEIAFIMGDDVREAADSQTVRAAVELAYPALEIVDSRIADWRIGITDTIADNASSGIFVLGGSGKPLNEFEPVKVSMEMSRRGQSVSRGTGVDCLGDPLKALEWLAKTQINVGAPLQKGDVVLSGALGPMVTVMPGDVFEARIEPLGAVRARFSERE